MEQRLIDANTLLKSSFRITGSWGLGNGRKQDFESISVKEIEAAPTVDAVPVVRCGECKWKPKCIHHKDEDGGIFGENDFCSYGERCDNDENDKVVMNDTYYVSEADRGRVWTVRSEPWNLCGTMVVLLEGKSDGYAVNGLDLVK